MELAEIWRSYLKHDQQRASLVCNNVCTRKRSPSSKECTTELNKYSKKKQQKKKKASKLICILTSDVLQSNQGAIVSFTPWLLL